MRRFRPLFAFLAVAIALVFLAGEADARRAGSAGSFGSRGARTNAAPPPTATAPNAASPMQRTMTTPAQQTAASAAAPAAGGMLGRFGGFGGGLMAGLLGAGLIGLLMGNGLFGGLAGFASILGLVLQVALIVIVARLAWAWWQRRNAPATAAGPSLRNATQDPNRNTAYYGSGAAAGATGYGGGAAVPPTTSEATLDKADFDDFERILTDVSIAYGAGDLGALRTRVTPEMLSYFSDDLAQSASRGLVSEVSDIKLLQGDLSEAWREGGTEYATVAMRYSIKDATIQQATGEIVEGSREPQEVTELWTFRRDHGGQWILSAIQQA